jgi:hypothetical protein
MMKNDLDLFRANPRKAPRRKFRGMPRYFRQIHREAKEFELDPAPDDWWDCWHYHADWPGWGNLGWSYRLEHIRALTTVFRKISSVQSRFPTPFQSWIYLNGTDASQDATYLHTPNPNRSEFPLKFDHFEWGILTIGPQIQALLPEFKLRIGRAAFTDDSEDPPDSTTNYLIYSPEVGISLE